MESHTPSSQYVTSNYVSNAFKYQVTAVQALLEEGFDHNAMFAIAKVVHEQGREGLDSYINRFLHAIMGASLNEVSSLINAVGGSIQCVEKLPADLLLFR